MNAKRGMYCGGVRTLEGLRNRCKVDDDTGCWNWRGATQTKPASMGGKVQEPRIFNAQAGCTTTISRTAWLLSGKPVPKAERWNVWRTCRNSLCGNPEHMRAGTKAQWGEWVRREGYMRGRPERTIINSRIAQETGKAILNAEQVQLVRTSPETGRALAKKLQASESAISRCRRGETYKPLPCSSVFHWRP